MANYEQLKQAVSSVIKTNGNQEITGQVLQNTLISMINSLGSNYQFVGIAETNTNPGTPDQNVFYLAGEGTYINFSNLTIDIGQIGILKWDGSWSKQVLEIGSGGGNIILEWNTDVATTRKQVIYKERKYLLKISYYNNDYEDVINEQYIGTSFVDSEWGKDSNWLRLTDLETLLSSSLQSVWVSNLKKGGTLSEENGEIELNGSNSNFYMLEFFRFKGKYLMYNNSREAKVAFYNNNNSDSFVSVVNIPSTGGKNMILKCPIESGFYRVSWINYNEGYGDNGIELPLKIGYVGNAINYEVNNLLNDIFIEKTTNNDYLLIDSNGNNILSVSWDGIIDIIPQISQRTINYLRNILRIEEKTKLPYQYRTILEYYVDCNTETDKNESYNTTSYSEDKMYKDYALLILPPKYSQYGEKTRLILWCHGAGGKNVVVLPNTNINDVININICSYYLYNGYAILMVNGLPQGFMENSENPNDAEWNHWGTPIALRSQIKAYEIVIKKYNIADDGVMVYGESMGGTLAQSIINSSGIPVLSCALYAPICDMMYKYIYNSDAETRRVIAHNYMFDGINETEFTDDIPCTGSDKTLLDNNIDKILPYSALYSNKIEVDGKNYIFRTVPTKVWHRSTDVTVDIDVNSKALVNGLKNAGCVAVLRTMNGGNHIQRSDFATTIFDNLENNSNRLYKVYIEDYEINKWFNKYN